VNTVGAKSALSSRPSSSPLHSVRSEERPASDTLRQPPPPLIASAQSQSRVTSLQAKNRFDFIGGFQTRERVSSASMSEVANQMMPKQRQRDNRETSWRPDPKPLFAMQDFSENDSTVMDKNENIYSLPKGTIEDQGWSAPVTPDNSGSLGSNMEMPTSPYYGFSPLIPPPCGFLSATSQLGAQLSHYSTVPVWQPRPVTGAMHQPSFQPPPPPPRTSSTQLPLSDASQQQCLPPACWRRPSPPAPKQLPYVGNSQRMWTSPLLPTHSVASEQLPAMRTSWQPHETQMLQPPPVTSVSTKQVHLSGNSQLTPRSGFDLTAGFQTMELISPASLSKEARKMPPNWSAGSRDKAAAKHLFEIEGANNASGMDDDDNVPASWEDIEEPHFPQIKSSATAATSSDCCSDINAEDCFRVKPGQLEATKWTMTFHKRASTPRVRCNPSVAHTAVSHSAPAGRQLKNCDNKKKRSLTMFRPDLDDSGGESVIDWTQQFQARYQSVITPFYDSHCHLDFLFRRSGFSGSFADYRQNYANTFPSSFAGCVAVFCNPKTWPWPSEGKIWLFLFQTCVREIIAYILYIVNYLSSL